MSRPLPGCPFHVPAEPHVYFIATADQRFVKIGWSTNVEERWRQIQGVHPEPLVLVGVLPGAPRLEAEWHWRFPYLRTIGEWFRLEEDLDLAIHKALFDQEEREEQEMEELAGGLS